MLRTQPQGDTASYSSLTIYKIIVLSEKMHYKYIDLLHTKMFFHVVLKRSRVEHISNIIKYILVIHIVHL